MGLGRTAEDRVIAVVTDNAASLLRIARAHSLCADDAQDAYQRALEIYLRRVDEVREATAGEWLRTVCKHEAMKIRDQRQRVLPAEEVAWDAQVSPDAREADERAASLERVAQAAEALKACKPDEATAILLKADGSSYAEIGELTGWTRTKVNRCLAEGRARFMQRFTAIDQGTACQEHAPVLSAIVDGEATPDDFARLRPHLRHCSSCRAALRDLYESEPALGALVPAGALVATGSEPVSGAVTRAYEALVTGLGDRIARAHTIVDAVASTKAAAVVASTAAVAAGGAAAADRVADREAPRRDRVAAVAEPRRQAVVRAGETARRRSPEAATATRRPRGQSAAPASTPAPAPVATPAATPDFAFETPRTAFRTPARPRPRATAADFGFEG